MTGARGSVPRVLSVISAIAVVATLGGCTAPAAQETSPSLDAVREERSIDATADWLRLAAGMRQYITAEWPDAAFVSPQFERWVDPAEWPAAVATCTDAILERPAGVLSGGGISERIPRPPTEPDWAFEVALSDCSLRFIPWSGSYASVGEVEHSWARHQITVALPNCVRRWGAELVVPDLNAAIDSVLYPTSAPDSATAAQSVWRGVALRRVDSSIEQQIRASCSDPGQTLAQLGPPEIRSLEFGPSGDGRTDIVDGQGSP